MKFSIELLSKGQADCFLLLFENDNGDECSILVDGNCEGKNDKVIDRISRLKKLDCIVVTHIDNDHIGGILSLFGRDENENPCIKDQLKNSIIIYNNLTDRLISYKQAERFEELIRDKKVFNSFSNRYNNCERMIYFLSIQTRKILKLNDYNKKNVYITFLNPDKNGVKEVINDYKKVKVNGNKANAKLINKNSIVLLIEFQGKKVLLTGDAYSENIKKAIGQLQEKLIPSPIDEIHLIKIPHHGADEYNKQIVQLSQEVKCNKLIITGKSEWDEKHPSKELLNNLLDNLSDELEIYTEVNLASIDDKFKNIHKDLNLKNEVSIL